MIMGNTIVTGSLIVFSDGFVWKILSNEKAYKIWVSAENEDFELYKVRVDDESESSIESLEDLQDAFKQGHYVCIEVGKLPYSIGLNYLRNLQEMSVAMEYLRISEQECVELYKASEDKLYFRYMLFNLGIVDRWKRESEELIAELEKLCGKKWVNPYKPEEERFVLTLTDEERSLIEERIKAGHYSSENIEKRRVEAHKAKMAAKRAEICERYDKKIRQAEAEKKIILCVFDYGLPINNVIYYPHTNTLSFNWNDYGGKITQEEFDDFVNKVDRSQLPEDIRFELK